MAGNNPILRACLRSGYDLQKLRIQTGNRLIINFYAKLGLKPGEKKDTLDLDTKKLLGRIETIFTNLTEGVTNWKTIKPQDYQEKGEGVITNVTELALISSYRNLLKEEQNQFKYLQAEVEESRLWKEFLFDVKGCGLMMAGVILSEVDFKICEYPSSLITYCGLDVAEDGRGRSKRKEHLIDVEYVDKKGEKRTKKSITYNEFFKTKMMGVLAPSFLKRKSPYKDVYDNYKHRLEQHPNHKEKTKLHRHNMAMRYMMKIFLKDLYKAGRKIEGLPIAPPYEEAKLGIKHRQASEGDHYYLSTQATKVDQELQGTQIP